MHYIASQRRHGAVSTKRIAEEFNIPAELLAKILQRLAKSQLIESHNGPKGGYVLSRGPDRDHGRAGGAGAGGSDPHRELPHRTDDCPQFPRCNLRRPVQKIQTSISQLLDTMTLAELTAERSCRGRLVEPRRIRERRDRWR